MDLVERHLIKKSHPNWKELDQLTFDSKNLYNKVLYCSRQVFFKEDTQHTSTTGSWIYHEVKGLPEYKALPAKVSNQVILQNRKSWSSYFALLKLYNSGELEDKPKPPKYKKKQSDRNIVTYDVQSYSKVWLNKGYFHPSGTELYVPTNLTNIKGGRIVPKVNGDFVVEILYEVEPLYDGTLDYNEVAGIDLGIDNIITLTSSKEGFIPIVANGKVVKSINQFYNKLKAKLQSKLEKEQYTSKRINNLTAKRTRKIDHILHTISRRVADFLYNQGIGTLVIGKNDVWKQDVNIGKRNNQNFVSIPHSRLVHMITYKCELLGIQVFETEESYTSKCSFLDREPMGKQESYVGRRIRRGLFKSSDGRLINADVNGSYNIMRKVFPNILEGIEDAAVHPIRYNFV